MSLHNILCHNGVWTNGEVLCCDKEFFVAT